MLPILLAFFLSQASGLEPSPTPVHPKSQAPANIPAESEVSASSGPVRLTFRIYKTRFKVGESLWYQLRVANRGSKMFRVVDRVFKDPWDLRQSADSRRGAFLIATDAKGRELETKYISQPHGPMPKRPFVDIEGDPKLKSRTEQWKQEGLSEQQIWDKAFEFTRAKRNEEARRSNIFIVELKPGDSIATPPWAYDNRDWDYDREIQIGPAPEPIGDFAELEMYPFREPGTYRIKAVYENRAGLHDPAKLKDLKRLAQKSAAMRKILADYAEEAARTPRFYEVRAETRWVEVTVSP